MVNGAGFRLTTDRNGRCGRRKRVTPVMQTESLRKKRSPQKCSNCGGEGRTARTCTKGRTNVRSDTLPQTTL